MPHDAAEFRKRAERCRRLAEMSIGDKEKKAFINLAKTWTKMADEIESKASLSADSSNK